MGHFLRFAGEDFYPGGGSAECMGVYDTLEAAENAEPTNVINWNGHPLEPESFDWQEIAEIVDGKLVARRLWNRHAGWSDAAAAAA